jgi:hypothetical protein
MQTYDDFYFIFLTFDTIESLQFHFILEFKILKLSFWLNFMSKKKAEI